MPLLVGRDTGGTTGDFNSNGNACGAKFTAVASGDAVVLKFHTKVANAGLTEFHLGVHNDDGSGAGGALDPGDRLAFGSTSTGITGTGIIAITITAVAIVSGTDYWLTWCGEGEQFDWQGENTGSYRETSGAVNTIPDPWGGSATTSNHNPIIWAETAAEAPIIVPDYSRFPKYKLRRAA